MYLVTTIGALGEPSALPVHLAPSSPPEAIDAAVIGAIAVGGVALGALGMWLMMRSKKR